MLPEPQGQHEPSFWGGCLPCLMSALSSSAGVRATAPHHTPARTREGKGGGGQAPKFTISDGRREQQPVLVPIFSVYSADSLGDANHSSVTISRGVLFTATDFEAF